MVFFNYSDPSYQITHGEPAAPLYVDKCVYEEESFLNMKRGEIVPFQEPCSLR